MRTVRVSILILLAGISAFIGVSPRKIMAQQGATQTVHPARPNHHKGQRPQLKLTGVRPAVTPGAAGLVSIPQFTDDKQTPTTGGPVAHNPAL